MGKLWLVAVGVFTTAMLKFAFAPPAAFIGGLPLWSAILLTIAGMMTTVTLVVIGGIPLRNWIVARQRKRNQRRFTRRNRMIVKIWQRSGIWGIALLTPIFLSPPIGAILAVSLGAPRRAILFSMFVSACFWAVVMCLAIYWLNIDFRKLNPFS
jgi:hypothetical protein